MTIDNSRSVEEVLVVSSKFYPEYSGSGFRAEQLYRRLYDRFGVMSKVLCGSVEFSDNKTFYLDELAITRVATAKKQWLAKTHPRVFCRLIVKIFECYEFILALRFLQKTKPKLIHAFGKSSVVSAAVYWARLRNIPLILELCNRMDDPHVDVPFISRLYRPRFDRLTVLVPISNELKNLCIRFGYLTNVWSRPNPVRPEIKFVSNERKKLNIRSSGLLLVSNKKRLLYVAKFMPQKNQRFLLKVLDILPSEYELLLVGPVVASGPNEVRDRQYLKAIQDEIQGNPNLQRRVRLIPEFANAVEIFGIADLYLFPAWNEALGTPMLEALVSGMPVVANESEPAFQQWLSDCPIGSLCPLDPECWAEEIERLILVSEKVRNDVSQKLLEVAGSGAIDNHYHRLLEIMTKAETDDQIDLNKYGLGVEASG